MRALGAVPRIAVSLLALVLFAGCTDSGIFDLLAARYAELSWTERIAVGVVPGGITTELTDVPVPVILNPGRIDYSLFLRDGADIEFRASQTGAVLPFELERWNPEGESIYWVRIPWVHPVDGAAIEISYGSRVAGDGNDPAAVWSNGYAVVLHFAEPGPPFADSSGNGNVAHADGAITAPPIVDGIVGHGTDFRDAGTAGLRIDPSPSIATLGPVSFEFALRGCGDCRNAMLLFRDSLFVRPTTGGGWPTLRYQQNFTGPGTRDKTSSDDLLVEQGFPWESDEWVFGSISWDGEPDPEVLEIRADGREVFPAILARGGTGDPVPHADIPLYIGTGGAITGLGAWTASFPLDGVLDEVRIATVPRSPDWARFQSEALRDRVIDWDHSVTTRLR